MLLGEMSNPSLGFRFIEDETAFIIKPAHDVNVIVFLTNLQCPGI